MGLTDYFEVIIVMSSTWWSWKLTYQSFLVKGSTIFFLAPFFPPIFSPLFLPTAILLQIRTILLIIVFVAAIPPNNCPLRTKISASTRARVIDRCNSNFTIVHWSQSLENFTRREWISQHASTAMDLPAKPNNVWWANVQDTELQRQRCCRATRKVMILAGAFWDLTWL